MNHCKAALFLITLVISSTFLTGCTIIFFTVQPPLPPNPGPPPGPNPSVRRNPNLKVEQFSAQVAPDGTVKVKGVVANSGLGPARLKTVVRVDRVPESGETVQLFDANIDALPPGQSAPFSGEIKPAQLEPSERIVIRATADSSRQLDESSVVNGRVVSNKDDNDEETSFQYGANLKVLNVTQMESSDPHVLKATADVRNLGNVTAPSFDIVWRVQVLNPDTITAAGTTGNTSSSGTISNGPDITTASTTSTAATSPATDAISTAGTGPAGPSQWYVLSRQTINKLDPNTRVTNLTYSLAQNQISFLPTGQSLDGKNVLLGVQVDPDGKVSEVAEGDNSANVRYNFPSGMPDIDVFALLAALDGVSNRIRFYPILANFGDEATGTFQGQWSRMPNSQLANTSSTTVTATTKFTPQTNDSIPPLQFANLNRLPEFPFDVQNSDLNQVVWLRYQADSGETVSERTDVFSGGKYRNGRNNFGDFIFYVAERYAADLAVTSISTAISDNGRTLTATGRIANLGNLGSGPFTYQWIFDGRAQPVVRQGNLTANGAPITVTRSIEVLEAWRRAGKVSVALKVIPGKEDRTTNNDFLRIERTIPRFLPGTDLAVTRVDLVVFNSGSSTFRGIDRARVTAVVENQGRDAVSGYTFNSAIIDGGPGASGQGGALGPKKSRTHTNVFNIRDLDTLPQGRTIFGKFTITARNPLVFVSRDSMQSAPKFLPLGSTGKDDWPDLNVTSVSYIPDRETRALHFYAAIRNDGNRRCPSVAVQWSVNGRKIGNDRSLPALDPKTSAGNADACYLDYTPTEADRGRLKVECAVGLNPNMVGDKNLDNNSLEISVSVNAPGEAGVVSSGTRGAVLQAGNNP